MTSGGLHGNRHDHAGPYVCSMSREDRMGCHVSVGVTFIFTLCSGSQNKNVFPTPIIKCIHPQFNQLRLHSKRKNPRHVSIQTESKRSRSRRSNREHNSRNSLCKGPEAGKGSPGGTESSQHPRVREYQMHEALEMDQEMRNNLNVPPLGMG